MKCIETVNAVGHVLCHDLTRIVKGEMKGAQFLKGHVVTEEDIPMLLSMGKEHLYVWEMDENMLHENDAAARLADICQNAGMSRTEPREGKIELFAEHDGVFMVDTARLDDINDIGEIMVATRRGSTQVKKGDKLCGTRVIPLIIDKNKLEHAEQLAAGTPLLSLLPYKLKRAAIITTGSEVFHGRIKDTFTPVVAEKLAGFGIEFAEHRITDDSKDHIEAAIREVREKNVDIICCTGGMSVDPDDMTPAAIRQSGADIVTYGAPVLPGAMFLLGYFSDGVPIVGLPGCVMYARATIFDIVLPRMAAGLRLSRRDITSLGNGGLCLGCKPCTYPNCGYGK